jgi:predicted permease
MLRKNPAFTLVAIGSLAIGIGFTSASFSIADALLLRPMPVIEPGRMVAVTPSNQGAFGTNSTISYPDYREFRDNNHTFDGLIASSLSSFGFSPDANTLPKVTFGSFVSGNYFQVLGVQPVLGRAFLDSENRVAGRDAVVILGHDFWVNQFNASPVIVGSTLRLNGVECKIVGLAGRQFTGTEQLLNPALFVPIAMYSRLKEIDPLERHDLDWFTIKGRLKPGIGAGQANADLSAIAARLAQLYPRTNRNRKIQVETELQYRVKQVPPQAGLAAMQGVMAICILLVACANVAGLLLSRARTRSREMAVRLAIGGSRGALVRQLLLENLLLAIAGGAAGVLLAYNITDFFNNIPIPADVPVSMKAAIDQRVLLFTIALSFLSTFVFGLAPALQTTRVDLVPSLKATDPDSNGRRRLWGRNLIVVGQVALSLLLLVITVVGRESFRDQLAHGPGFRTDHLYLTGFNTEPVHYSREQTRKFYQDLLLKARQAPGVRSAALTSGIPLGFDYASVTFIPEGYSVAPGQQPFNTMNFYVSDGYFATQGIRILRGRGLLETDRDGAPLVAVVNSHFAAHYWPNKDAIGKRFHLGDAGGPLVQVVGITDTVKYVWVAEPPLDFIYLPYTQHNPDALTVLAESATPDAAALAPVLRDVVRNIDPSMPVVGARTMRDFYTQRAVKTSAILGDVIASLGFMGLVLAMVGLYALVAYSASRRSREIGIRMAIGADRVGVLRMVLRQGLVLGCIGAGAGLILSFFACRALAASLWVLAGKVNYALLPVVALPLLAVTLLAAFIPARRASLIDPVRALRDE